MLNPDDPLCPQWRIKACRGKSRQKNSFSFDSRLLTKAGYSTKELVRTSQIKLIFLWVEMNCLWAIKLTRPGLAAVTTKKIHFDQIEIRSRSLQSGKVSSL